MLMHRNDALPRCIVPTACVVVFPERLGFAGAAAATAESAGGAALAAKGGLGEQQQQQQQQQQTGGAQVWFAEGDRLERFSQDDASSCRERGFAVFQELYKLFIPVHRPSLSHHEVYLAHLSPLAGQVKQVPSLLGVLWGEFLEAGICCESWYKSFVGAM